MSTFARPLLAALVLATAAPLPALAQRAQGAKAPSPPPASYAPPTTTLVVTEDETVEGGTARPQGDLVESLRPRKPRESLLKPPANFLAQMLKSVENL